MTSRCANCSDLSPLGFDFTYAYQPIVDTAKAQVFAHEALVRGPGGEGAGSVLDQVNEANRYRFDQACRVKAIALAAQLAVPSRLSINFLPNAIYRPEVCIRTTLEAAREHGFPVERIIIETVEGEKVRDGKWLAEVFREYRRIGFRTAIDDFGAGFAGLNLLADFQPDIIKLDMGLIRGIDASRPRRVIVESLLRMCGELSVDVVAEGVETLDEYHCLADMGIQLFQGYLFSRPIFEGCVQHDQVQWPAVPGGAARTPPQVA
jgi:EAL domain-containing protein (putative c-di-GMP-specific phosphodiesterase class I)